MEVKRKEIYIDLGYRKLSKIRKVSTIYCGKTIMSRRKKKLFQCESDKWNRIVQWNRRSIDRVSYQKNSIEYFEQMNNRY